MKKLSFTLFLSLSVFGYLHAQNNSPAQGKVGIYNSPPVASSVQKSGSRLVPLTNLTAKATAALSFINGSFELNTGRCIINGSNELITSDVVATNAYGCAHEIDLMSNDCGYGTAISGNYFLCLSDGNQICTDACNLELNAKLVTGKTYTISYFDRGYNDVNGCCPPGVVLEVGASTTATEQGTLLYTSPVPVTNIWSQRSFSFVAPNNGKYISFKAKDSSGRWTHIDSVTISGAVCEAPYNLQVPKVDSTAAKLTWSVPKDPVGVFRILYRVKGGGTVWLEKKAGTESVVKLFGLSPHTTYEWIMRSFCEGSNSVVVYGPDFTTLSSPDMISGTRIFPNPVKNNIQVEGLSAIQKSKLSIVDLMGNIKATIIITGSSYNWKIPALKPGNYILKIETNNTVVSRWFVKE